MKITIKNIKINERLSQETTAFSADLLIDGKKVGTCGNYGTGGPTIYHPLEFENLEIIEQAEKYCIGLPKIPVVHNRDLVMIDSTLQNVIDEQVSRFANNKELQRFERQKQRDMSKAILIGTEEKYVVYNLNRPLDQIIHLSSNPAGAINLIINQLRSKIKQGERILNTNLPAGVILPETVNA